MSATITAEQSKEEAKKSAQSWSEKYRAEHPLAIRDHGYYELEGYCRCNLKFASGTLQCCPVLQTPDMPYWIENLAHDVWNYHPSDRSALKFMRDFLALRPERLSDDVAIRLAHFDMMSTLERHAADAPEEIAKAVQPVINLHRQAWESKHVSGERWEAALMRVRRVVKDMTEESPGYWLLRITRASTDDYSGAPHLMRSWMARSGDGQYSPAEARGLAKDVLALVRMGHALMRKERRAKAKANARPATPAKIAA